MSICCLLIECFSPSSAATKTKRAGDFWLKSKSLKLQNLLTFFNRFSDFWILKLCQVLEFFTNKPTVHNGSVRRGWVVAVAVGVGNR